MSLKDDVKYVKEELSSDEKLLESAFRVEKFYKKHRIKLYALLAVVVLGLGGKAGYDAYREYQLNLANKALITLQKSPNDRKALETLRNNNPELFALYSYSHAIEKGNVDALSTVVTSGNPLLEDLSRYHQAVLKAKAGNSRYYSDLSRVEKAYLALKAGKKEEARSLLALVGEDSPVAGIARLLRHATLK